MKIYFVRHGEARSNVDMHTPAHEDGLTETGKRQARALAERFKGIPVDAIISSSFSRARETAEAISAVVRKPITENISVRERDGYFEQLDEYKHLPARQLEAKARALISGQEWSIGESEPYEVMIERLMNAKRYLEGFDAEHLVVVSHVGFMRAFIGMLILGESITYEQCLMFQHSLWIKNSGVTILDFNKEARRWRVETVNDLAHLSK